MSADCFLDANILIYAVSIAPDEAAKKQTATKLIAQENFGVSAQVRQEFYVTVTRKFKQPLSTQDALNFVSALAAFPFVPVDWKLFESAVAISVKHKTS
jgi:predicted nucleic acid-binding protein